MTKKLTVQDIIFTLEQYWADQGCMLMQAYDNEKGAGTMSPYTFLRAIGPEPWNVAYVEPSRRPADGRYGENPNRLYQHHQFQVLMEVTQFTYFQVVGELPMSPVAAEVTYGLERLAEYIQNVDSVYDLEWADGVLYGDIFQEPEYEHSKYAFEESNQDMLLQDFNDYEKEAKRLIKLGLVHPAYDYVLKCSHTFNLLDARGAVSVTERAGYLHRIRIMAKSIAKAFVEERRKRGFPLIHDEAVRQKTVEEYTKKAEKAKERAAKQAAKKAQKGEK